jgi:hypothetical protein
VPAPTATPTGTPGPTVAHEPRNVVLPQENNAAQTAVDGLNTYGINQVNTPAGPVGRGYGPGRQVSPEEAAELRNIYGDSLDTSRIRVHDNLPDGGFWGNGRATSIGDHVYLPEGTTKDVFVHEAAHQWQYQNGGAAYISRAGAAQSHGDTYDWRSAPDGGRTWSALTPEQQAEVVQDAYNAGFFTNPNNPSISEADRAIYTNAQQQIQNRRGAPGALVNPLP